MRDWSLMVSLWMKGEVGDLMSRYEKGEARNVR